MHDIYKLSDKVLRKIEPLLEMELYQSNFYKQLGITCNGLGFLKAQKYFYQEAVEENEHAMMWIEYITGRGGSVDIPSIDQPVVEGGSLYELTEQALAIEAKVSDMYQATAKEMMDMCQMTYNEILKFIEIQKNAVAFYSDAAAVLKGLDKTGELVAERIFK